MNEDFVPFKLAKKLKYKGYPYETTHNYDKLGRICVSLVGEEYPYPCPEIHQVLKWLRDEKKMNVNVRLLVENGWYFSIQDYMGVQRYSMLQDAKDTDDLYYSYEGAAIAGITYCLDNH